MRVNIVIMRRISSSSTVAALLALATSNESVHRCQSLNHPIQPRPPPHLSRQTFLRNAAVSLPPAAALILSSWMIDPLPADAARGAAELDLEYYARDLFGGNRKEGSIQASQLPELPPPRTLQEPFLSLLLPTTTTDIDTPSSLTATATNGIPVTTLISILKQTTKRDESVLSADLWQRVSSYRDKAQASFYKRAPWKTASCADQYYFDLTAYAFWRAAADLCPDYVDRDRFVRQMGRNLYRAMQETSLIRKQQPSESSATLVETIPRVKEILDVFQSSGFCKEYRLGDAANSFVSAKSRKDESTQPQPIFDSLDDEALMNGATVDCLVSVFETATLGASLQITGEQSRFTPDFVGPTLAALWEDSLVSVETSWETFFVDNEYRPNPKDYFPNEQLLQFSISKS